MMVAGDEVYVRDYHYADRSGVIVRAPTMIILQKHSQPRSMVQRHEIVYLCPSVIFRYESTYYVDLLLPC